MEWNWKEYNKQKHLFRSYYCPNCKQENKEHGRQLLLLKNYRGCSQCGSLEVDAWNLYEDNRLICQPCRMRKEGGASGAISFSEKSKWYKKRWGIDLGEWLENYGCLPVNYKCAERWLKDKEHLKKCDCLEQEAKEYYLLFSNSLKKMEGKLKECKCKSSSKVRVGSDDYVWCEGCDGTITAASKKRVIKNRNDPRFWGLSVMEKVLCLACIGKEYYEVMEEWQRKKFREYIRRGYI